MKANENSVLVAGSGSIGRRHMRNLRSLGVSRIGACDPQADRLEPMVQELGIRPFADFDEGLTAFKPDLVFVCSPPVAHVQQALAAVRAGAHVFVEKPLSNSLDGVEELAAAADRAGRVVQVGYNLRFHPSIRRLKEILDTGAIGRVLYAHVEVGSYLPDWRPWQDYRQNYTARKDLGGGIILDASHELDYTMWLMGTPVEVLCLSSKVSALEIRVEDCATVLLRFESGAQADVHMDMVQRVASRNCKLVGELGTAEWDESRSEVRLQWPGREPQVWSYPPDDGGQYVLEVRDFFDCVQTGREPLVTLEQAARVLKVCLQAKGAAAHA